MSKHTKPTHVYVVRVEACGCIIGWIAYHYDWRDRTAQLVNMAIKDGRLVELVTWDRHFHKEYEIAGCDHGEQVACGVLQAKLAIPD